MVRIHPPQYWVSGVVEEHEHLSALHATHGDDEKALDLYARAVYLASERTVPLPEALADYVGSRFEGDGLADWVKSRRSDYAASLALLPQEGKWTWPEGAKAEGTHHVQVVALVDPEGRATQAEIVAGTPPWADAALADAKRLRFPVVAWDGRPIRTLRLVAFTYQPGAISVTQGWSSVEAVGEAVTDRP